MSVKTYTLKPREVQRPTSKSLDFSAVLNPPQIAAVTNIQGPQLVIAGAGSGKTRTLIYRVAYLISQGIDPQSILLLTFTRKAAEEMMQRAAAVADDRCAHVAGGTFHSFANTILRRYAELIGYGNNFTIIDRSDAEDVVNIIRTNLGLNRLKKRFPRKKALLEIISGQVNTGLPLLEVIADKYPQYAEQESYIAKIVDLYAAFKKTKSLMDYDDLLVKLKLLLDKHADVRKKLSATYRYIMVDEYQDTNKIQAHIACLLASEHENLMVVGDDSQSIYSFRGANFRNIMDFPKIFPTCKVTTLEQNYRSTQPILNLTNAILAQAGEKFKKELFSNISGTQKPVYLITKNEKAQAAFICQRILELREEGVPLNQMAVLFRAAWESSELEIDLAKHNIPFRKFGGIKFVEAAHVKDMLSLLKIQFNPLDAVGWLRILLLLEGVGPKSAQQIIGHIVDDKAGIAGMLHKNLSGRPFAGDLSRLHKLMSKFSFTKTDPATQLQAFMKFYRPLLKNRYDDYQKRLNDLDSLTRIAEGYAEPEKFLSDMSLEPPSRSQIGVDPEEHEDEKLNLSTIHSAKGLEWHTVFVLDLIDGYIPSAMSLYSEEDIEEERRLLYVATTRPKRNLYLITPQLERNRRNFYRMPGMDFTQPSRFLQEIKNFSELTEQWALAAGENKGKLKTSGNTAAATKGNGKRSKTLDRIEAYFGVKNT